MVFSSPIFLFAFLPLVLLVYFFAPEKFKNIVLLIFSLFFYAWGEPIYVFVMLLVIWLAYKAGLLIEKYQEYKKVTTLISSLAIISVLIYFKYTDFFIITFNDLSNEDLPLLKIIMPIGISFYIFQSVSYIIDVYRKTSSAQHSFIKMALYISFFPQLIAGPIVKYHDIEKYLEKRTNNLNNVVLGMKRFIYGLGKKVLIANTLGKVADDIFKIGPSGIDPSVAWLGSLAYTFQIFFDFSGYSDMAIGLGRMFGFKILENFNYPYMAKSITDFWRRWHISLSTWFKEYVYIPLGGNRVSDFKIYRNLIIVFALTGFWHGANWTFIAWGLWHGAFLIIEKNQKFKMNNGLVKSFLGWLYTSFIVVFGWVLFRADNIQVAYNYMLKMLGIGSSVGQFPLMYYLNNKIILAFAIAVFCSLPIATKSFDLLLRTEKNLVAEIKVVLENSFVIAILFLSIMYIAGSTYNPFIYFRF